MKSILFDLDGTLVNSSPGIKGDFRYAFEELQLPSPTDQQLSTFIGPPLEVTFSHYFDKKSDIALAIQTFRHYYNKKGVYQTSLYPDILQLLMSLTTAGYPLYVTTSKNEPMAKLMLHELQVDSYFTEIFGALPERFHKADVIKACLAEHKIAHRKAVIIGDTTFDIIGGKKAGIQTLGVTWGFGLETDLENSGADAICHTPLEILKVISE